MGWKDRAEAYKEIGSIAGKRDDDFCARRILRGIGWTERGLPKLCMLTGVPYDGAEPLISLVRKVLDAVSLGSFDQGVSRKFILDVRTMSKGACWADGDELRELCEISSTVACGMIVLCRRTVKGGNDECMAFVFLKDEPDIPAWIMQPLSLLKERKNGFMIWERKAEELFGSMVEFLHWEVPSAE